MSCYCQYKTIAMSTTAIYWINVFLTLFYSVYQRLTDLLHSKRWIPLHTALICNKSNNNRPALVAPSVTPLFFKQFA
jgi:hypothetical protein